MFIPRIKGKYVRYAGVIAVFRPVGVTRETASIIQTMPLFKLTWNRCHENDSQKHEPMSDNIDRERGLFAYTLSKPTSHLSVNLFKSKQMKKFWSRD